MSSVSRRLAAVPSEARTDVSISSVGEFGLIERVVARLGDGPQPLVGPGDDAAVIAAPDGRVVASTDVLVEGRHFRRDWSSARDVGHRAAAANLADIAAMGAVPTALLVAFCAPPELDVAWAEELADGLAEEAARAGASVVGGDMSGAPLLMISVTALGDLGGRPPVRRDGARAGDVLALAGRGARRRPVHLDPHRWRGSRPGGHLPGRDGAPGRLAADRVGGRGERGHRGRRGVRRPGRLGTLPVSLHIQLVPYGDPVATALVEAALADLSARYGGDGDSTPVDPAQFTPPEGEFLVAWLDGRPVGCGAWRTYHGDPGVAEVK